MSSNYINGDQLKEILTSGFSDVKDYIDNNSGGSGGAGLKIEDFNELVLNGDTDLWFDESFDETITEDVFNKLKNADILKFTDGDNYVYIGHKTYMWFSDVYDEAKITFTFTLGYGSCGYDLSDYTLRFYIINIVKTDGECHVYMPPTYDATLSPYDRKKIKNMPTHQHTVAFYYNNDYMDIDCRFSFSLLGPDYTPYSFGQFLNIINDQKQTLPITYLASGLHNDHQVITCTIKSISSSDITVCLRYDGMSPTYPAFNSDTFTMPASAYSYIGSVKLMDY